MRFRRYLSAPLSTETLRALGARQGAVVDSPDVLRVGLGSVVDSLVLEHGLSEATPIAAFFDQHHLEGPDAPAGTGLLLFASLPFDRSESGHLDLYEITVTRFRDGDTWVTICDNAPDLELMLAEAELPSQETQSATALTLRPSGEEYAHNVARAVERLRSGEMDKVVLARSVVGTVDEAIDPAAVAQRLRRRETRCTIYASSVPGGRRFVGASPELLVSRIDGDVLCHPLAGTIAIPPHIAPDDYQNWLLGSAKNLREHSLLVDAVTTLLAEHYAVVTADPTPSIVSLRTVAHLGTWIRAREATVALTNALDLIALLHPTAAVGGLPQQRALQVINELEGMSRGHYAGPVGWIDEKGDGEWWIAIRGVMLEGRDFEAWAGAGIVSESDPVAEREETKDKLASILAAVLVDRL